MAPGEHDKILYELGEIKGTLTGMKDMMEAQAGRTTKVEDRITKVEGKQSWYSGAAAVVGMALGALGGKGLGF
jgi:hypothetical protein